ncbi:MAG TPA: tail fiber domain-containing protein, partial [Pyrinomonadaceae bacterium]|nr:tail fiber domain-containing protein [Pyrinomonadaceae bacterium]
GTVCFNPLGDLLQCGSSSLKWKTDVRPFNLGLETVLRLRPINFNWKESGLADFGLGAEDVAKVAPELTLTDEQGEVKGVKYDHLNVVFINAFKEQQAQIEAQDRRNEAQQKQIETLRAKNDALKKQNTATEARLVVLEQMMRQLMEQMSTTPQPKQR